MKRYSAKLLFQFQVTVGGSHGQRRTCEERIVLIKADSAAQALALAKQKGRDGEYSYTNSDGNPVDVQFIGVMELLRLDLVCEEDEVWYDITERLLPMERRDRFIPPEHTLEAIRNESNQGSDREIKKGI
jgi:hypothetical protein